jgi:hypothetical protein
MNLVTHIVNTDARRLRIPLALWGLFVALDLAVFGAQIQTGQPGLGIWMTALFFFQQVLVLLLVPVLIQNDLVIGSTAFWISRPIAPLKMLSGKLAFIGFFLVVLPLVLTIPLLLISGMPLKNILEASFTTGIQFSRWLLLLVALAALTRNLASFFMAGVLYLILSIGCFIIAVYCPACTAAGKIPTAVSLAVLGLALALLYQKRKRAAPVALLAVDLVLFALFAANWFSIPGARIPAVTTELNPESITASLHKHNFAHDYNRRHNNRRYYLQGQIDFSGLPSQGYAVIRKISAEFAGIDGITIRSIRLNPSSGYNSFRDTGAALEQAVAPRELDYFPPTFVELLKISLDELKQLRDTAGHYRAELVVDIYQYEAVAKLPVEVGAEASIGGEKLTIQDLRDEEYGCRVILTGSEAESFFDKNQNARVHLFLNNIEHRARVPSQLIVPENPVYGGTFDHLAIINGSLMYTRSTDNMLFEYCDEVWRRRGELLILEPRFCGTIIKHVECPDFVIDD